MVNYENEFRDQQTKANSGKVIDLELPFTSVHFSYSPITLLTIKLNYFNFFFLLSIVSSLSWIPSGKCCQM